MDHTITYTVDDGTTYRFQYDNETQPPEPGRPAQMHYLVFEDGTLKLETWHHALPEGLTEDDFRSTVVLGAFFNCLGRTMQEIDSKAELEASPIHAYKQLATLIDPHMRIRDEHVEWVRSVMARHHDAELYVKLAQDAQIEQFARELDGKLSLSDELAPGQSDPEEDEDDYVRPAHSKARQFLATYYPAIAWVVVVVALAVAYVLASGV